MVNILFVTIIFNLFALATILLRPAIFGVKLFRPMIYNFKLSCVPVFILLGTLFLEIILMAVAANLEIPLLRWISYLLLLIGLVIWLLFLPNAGYLVTELNLTHREMDTKEVPIWYDIVSVLSFAISGVLNMALNIIILQFIFIIYLDPAEMSTINTWWFWLPTVLIFFLMSFGIYLGRYIRFYSWDLLHPKQFITKLIEHFKQKENRKHASLFTFLYGIFFGLFYALTFLNPLLTLFRR